MRTDVAVIGGGIVGLATAARLARAGLDVVVLERHDSFGRETSSRNSEVVHAGMYYPTGSLKARLCVAGNRSLYAWCEAHGVPHCRIGKFVVATAPDEMEYLDGLLVRGRANGVTALRWADPAELQAAEPHVRAHAALWSPDTGIVDSHALMQSLLSAAASDGAAFAWGHRCLGVETLAGGYRLRIAEPGGGEVRLRARGVVNAAGLSADLVAASAGIDTDAAGYRLCFVKGSYFRIRDGRRGLVRHLVYPVPAAGLAGLGIHVTVDLAGGLRLGPDVEFLSERVEDYHVEASRAESFVEAASRYLPDLTPDDVSPDHAGIRARLITASGGVPDFVIAEETARGLPGWVNLVGIESPGLTACLEIASEVARLLDAD